MYRVLLVFFFVSFAVSASENKPPLWAMYYGWYEVPSEQRAKHNYWTDSTDARKPKSRAEPLIGCYSSDDPAVVRWHIQLAQAAGIEAFLVSWWDSANVSGRAFQEVILPVAAQEHFKVALCNELAQFHSDLKTLTRRTAGVLKKSAKSPAYLRIEGKPVVYLYQIPFNPKLTIAAFDELVRGVEEEVGPVYWIMDKISNPRDSGLTFPSEWLSKAEISMFGFYGTFSVKRVWKYKELAEDYLRLAGQAHSAGKKVFLPVHPGHDNSGFRPGDHFIIPRQDGATLRGYLRAADEAKADVVLVTSFNEWPETTVVEPSSSWRDPYVYLKVLAEWKGVEFATPPLPGRKDR